MLKAPVDRRKSEDIEEVHGWPSPRWELAADASAMAMAVSRATATRSHKASQDLTRSHKVSQGPTRSHKVSQSLISIMTVDLQTQAARRLVR